MGEKSRNHSHVSDLALEVVQGVADRKALADFRTLAEANGYEGRPGGWIYNLNGAGATLHDAVAHGWSRFAQLVVNGTVRLRTVREIEAASNTVPVDRIDAGTVTNPFGQAALTPSERAYRAGYAHPVVVGQPCGASSFYTKVEHGGLLAAYRSRTSGARWVLCSEHVKRSRRDGSVYPVDTEYEHGLALSLDGIRTAAAAERAKRKARCDACSTLRLVDDLARVRVVGGAGSSETESYCRGGCPREMDVEAARAMALVVEAQRAAADREIMSLRYDCGDCTFATADRSRMMAHYHATGHVTATAAPTPGTAEYELDKLRGAFTLACRSRDLWRERAKAAGVKVVDDDPARDDDSSELLDRIVRRAQYTALVAMLAAVDGWVEGVQENCKAFDHRHGNIDEQCGQSFGVGDIRNMVNDAAREVGTAEPHRG